MEEPELKLHLDELRQLRCRICLSVGRRLKPIGEHFEIYMLLKSGFAYGHYSSEQASKLSVCWECHWMLRKIEQFQMRLRQAEDILEFGQFQHNLYGTLSSLTTVVLNDIQPKTVYFEEHIVLPVGVVKNECSHDTENCHDNCHEIEEMASGIDTAVHENRTSFKDISCIKEELNTEPMQENVEKKTKARKKQRWAEKRALQNKKPKYRTVLHQELNLDMTFKRTEVDIGEIQNVQKKWSNKCVERLKCKTCVIDYSNVHSGNNITHFLDKDLQHYTCDVCDAQFKKKRVLAFHIKNHYFKYKCRLCQFICDRKRQRSEHVEKEHKTVFQCLKCELQFGERSEVLHHFRECHEKFVCDHCGVSFKMRYCIKDHIRKQHTTFNCQLCDKRFARYNALWLHNKTRHAPATPPAYCVECDKRFVDVYRYRWHLANSVRHTPRKAVRIPCGGCDKVFTKNIYMRDHYNLVHLKQFKYRCDECDKNFIRNADLVKHRRRVHQGILPPKDKMCFVCGRGFTTNKILLNHTRTHTGERPFACARCPARFAQRAALTSHAKALHQQ